MYHIKIVKKVKKHKNYEIRNKDDKFLKSAVTTIKQYIFDEYKSSSIAHILHIKLTWCLTFFVFIQKDLANC